MGTCSPAPSCITTLDCPATEVCSAQGLCLGVSQPAVNEAGSDAALASDVAEADSAEEADAASPDAACGDTTSDPNNCGQCNSVCSSGLCVNSKCLNPAPYGNYEPAPGDMWTYDAGPIAVTPASEDAGLGTLAGVKVTLPGGWLTELDILTLHGGQHGYLGLYSNANDEPSQLVAATSEIIVQGDSPANSIIPANSIPQTTQGPVSPTHIDPGDYWIIGAWDSEIFIII